MSGPVPGWPALALRASRDANRTCVEGCARRASRLLVARPVASSPESPSASVAGLCCRIRLAVAQMSRLPQTRARKSASIAVPAKYFEDVGQILLLKRISLSHPDSQLSIHILALGGGGNRSRRPSQRIRRGDCSAFWRLTRRVKPRIRVCLLD